MNGWDHVLLTTIGFIASWIVLQFFFPTLLPAAFSFWFLLVAWVGGIFPDFDLHWKPLLGHRSVVTHSILAPLFIVGLFFAPIYFFGWWVPIDRFFITVFLLGCAGHLLLDLAPSSTSVLNRFLKNPLEAIVYIEKSQKAPPGNITYIPKKYERGWLIGNAITLIVIAFVLYWVFLTFFP